MPLEAVEHLPEWDLSDLYPSMEAPEIQTDLARIDAMADSFASSFKGKLAELTGDQLGAAIEDYERLTEIMHRLYSYADLQFAGDVSDANIGRFRQTLQEKLTDISSKTLFFTLELNRLDDAVLDRQLEDPRTGRYASWIRDNRVFRVHQLSDELEEMLHQKSVAGRSAWTRLFEETMAHLRFPVDGVELPVSDALNLLSDKDGAKRKAAAQSVGKVLGDNIRLFAHVTNTLAKDKEIEDRWRQYPHPAAERNLANLVEDEVVEALVTSVQKAYGSLGHRYYALKAKWFGLDKMDYWDRNAPVPGDADRLFSWDEARETVMTAYGTFSPELAKVAEPFFDNRWIDVPPRPGKAPGAFAHPTVPSVHPYLLLNFHGKSRDVMTLAHELGHGVHQVLAGDQGTLMADTPLTLAETASVFGEMLVFRALLDNETDPARRRILLASKVEDMLNTVVRQVAFHQFEERVHGERQLGELSVEQLGGIWMDVQRESLGPAFRFHDEYKHFWAYIPHFVHTPFYVYAYAFGDCLVNSLYAVFQDGHPGFQAKYMEMLKAGGTLRHKDLLAPFGLDAGDPAFWRRGLDVIAGFIDELEAEA
ncbi:Putative peptidase M3B, oligoendopeptidase-related clade 3 [Magnetospira sp. QH-2]|nr:M3 family oligoendopeptidase [Magnetospira sp. QH-2]CCQ74094.1 Putative peptidase M3B, oligoendopeptidase-related clade 3 [Magnetospira sp. QH-2]